MTAMGGIGGPTRANDCASEKESEESTELAATGLLPREKVFAEQCKRLVGGEADDANDDDGGVNVLEIAVLGLLINEET